MNSIREADLSQRFNEFLDRFSPPRGIVNNPTAMQQDADAMLQTVLRYAPKSGHIEWLEGVLRTLQEGMTTRSWPAPGELAKACKGGGKEAPAAPSEAVEEAAIGRMIAWYEKFGTQAPGQGNHGRTAELIRRGVLKDEKFAHFKGFDLSEDQRRRAKDQPTSREQWQHHVRVTARLHGISEQEAEFQIRAEGREPMDRSATGIPDKSAPYRAEAFAAE